MPNPPIDDIADRVIAKLVGPGRPQRRLFDLRDACEYLGLTEPALRNKVSSGQIPHVHIDRKLRFDRLDLDRWIEQHRMLED